MLKQFNEYITLKWMYIITIGIYIVIDTRFSIPYDMILRWVLPLILLTATSTRSNGGIKLFPNVFYLLIILYFAFTILFSTVKSYSIQRLISLVLVVGMYYSYYIMLSKRGELESTVSILGLIYVVYGIANFAFIGVTVSGRSIGITSSANSLGIESNISLVFASFFYEKSDKKYKKIWFLFMIAFALEAILSGSRMATAALILFFFYALIFVFKKKSPIVIPIVLIIVLVFLPNNSWRDIPGLNRLITLGMARDDIWRYAINVYKQKPWFGYGYGSVNTTVVYSMAEGLGYHSSYLTILIETGRIGLALVILFLLNTFLNACKSYRNLYSIELRIMIVIFFELLLSFYSESSMTSAGSIEGFIFWGVVTWLIVKYKQDYLHL